MKAILLACALTVFSTTYALAQQYDSGWKIVAADALSDLEFSGGGMRINNFAITQHDSVNPNSKLATYLFSATAMKRATGKRSVRVELIGFKEDKTPSIASIIGINIYDENANKVSVDEHRFLAVPKEVTDTRTYFIRVMVP